MKCEIMLGHGAISALPHLCGQGRALIVGDDNTLKAAAIEKWDGCTLHSLGKTAAASLETVQQIMEHAHGQTLLIAVGSGTINDCVKLASYRLQMPYLSVATAASMNGYLSPTASLTAGAHKKSFAAAPPKALIADTAVLCAAPTRLTQAGIGDTICRSSIEADMLLAQALTGAPYEPEWFDELRAQEVKLMAHEGALHSADFIEDLMRALLIGGRMMQAHGSSAPCSQGEHMLVHCFETLHTDGARVLHGEAVAVATIAMRELQEQVLHSPPKLRNIAHHTAQIEARFGARLGDQAQEAFLSKHQGILWKTPDWSLLSEKINARCLSAQALKRALQRFGCPTLPEDIGWSKSAFEEMLSCAYLTRDRLTFLDIAAMYKD